MLSEILLQKIALLYPNHTNYFLKQFNTTDTTRVEQIIYAENFFAQHNIPVITTLPTIDETNFFTHESNIYALYPYMEGKKVARSKLTNKHLTEMATLQATMHQLAKKPNLLEVQLREEWVDQEIFDQRYDEIIDILHNKPELDEFDQHVQSSLLLKKFLQEKYSLEKITLANDTLIHGDFVEHNIFFNPANSIQYIFDFEKAEYAPRHFDLIRSVSYICFDNNFTKENFKKAHLYLLTYDEIYPIDREAWKKAIDYFVWHRLHATGIEYAHYIHHNNRRDEMLQSQINTLLYFEKHLHYWINELINI